jgi:hypothetical protein
MFRIVCEARKKYKEGIYLTVFPHGLVVPWKPLRLQDYILYTREISQSPTNLAFLEDEVFCKSVVEQTFVRQIDFLSAGIVSTVVQNIIQHSGPNGIDAFNQDLENQRMEILEGPSAVLHDLVSLITNAFPYKPEEIYAMDYETFLLRVVQAEKKLLTAGIIKEPVHLISKDDPKKKRRVRTEIDAQQVKEAFDQQFKKKPPVPQPVVDKKALDSFEKAGKWWKKSPILEVPLAQRENIDFHLEAAEQEAFGSSGWEKVDRDILSATMVKDAQKTYADVLVELAKRKASTKKK